VFIETVNKLKPKVVIMENVEGLIKGEAWGYVQKIYKNLMDIGYSVKHWLLKGENMGVPQKRHRVFFVAIRNDIDFDLNSLDMSFNYEPVTYGMIKAGDGGEVSEVVRDLLNNATERDSCLADIIQRKSGKWNRFNEKIIWDKDICPTVQSHGMYRGNDKCKFSMEDYRNAQTFPQDYQFESVAQAAYICGMSVPPLMIKRIVLRLIESGLFEVANEI
jgi:DNA (cytosine-5)-methyltransferase 1